MGWDLAGLKWMNLVVGRPEFDSFFVFVTHARNYLLPALGIAGCLLWRGGRRARLVLAALVICVGLSDGISSRIIKPLVGRIRPCNAVAGLRLPDGASRTLSFPSSHAVNSAAAATVMSLAYPPLTLPAAAGVVLVGLSRVYLGLHYPSDVLLGWAFGSMIGYLTWRLFARAVLREA